MKHLCDNSFSDKIQFLYKAYRPIWFSRGHRPSMYTYTVAEALVLLAVPLWYYVTSFHDLPRFVACISPTIAWSSVERIVLLQYSVHHPYNVYLRVIASKLYWWYHLLYCCNNREGPDRVRSSPRLYNYFVIMNMTRSLFILIEFLIWRV